jgi:hypothetical protein
VNLLLLLLRPQFPLRRRDLLPLMLQRLLFQLGLLADLPAAPQAARAGSLNPVAAAATTEAVAARQLAAIVLEQARVAVRNRPRLWLGHALLFGRARMLKLKPSPSRNRSMLPRPRSCLPAARPLLWVVVRRSPLLLLLPPLLPRWSLRLVRRSLRHLSLSLVVLAPASVLQRLVLLPFSQPLHHRALIRSWLCRRFSVSRWFRRKLTLKRKRKRRLRLRPSARAAQSLPALNQHRAECAYWCGR